MVRHHADGAQVKQSVVQAQVVQVLGEVDADFGDAAAADRNGDAVGVAIVPPGVSIGGGAGGLGKAVCCR